MSILTKNTLAPIAASIFLITSIGAPAVSAPMTCSSATTYLLSDAVDKMCYFGNDTPTVTSTFSMFGDTGWILSDKNDGPDGDGAIEYVTAPINGTKSGNWLLDTLAGASKVVLTLKAGNGWGAFLLDLTTVNPLSGLWETNKDLSHSSVYYQAGDTPPPSPIPLPAGFPLLLTALAALGLAGRRRKQ